MIELINYIKTISEGFCTQVICALNMKKSFNENSVVGGNVLNPDAFYSASLCLVL